MPQTTIEQGSNEAEKVIFELFSSKKHSLSLLASGAIKIDTGGHVTVLPSIDELIEKATERERQASGEVVAIVGFKQARADGATTTDNELYINTYKSINKLGYGTKLFTAPQQSNISAEILEQLNSIAFSLDWHYKNVIKKSIKIPIEFKHLIHDFKNLLQAAPTPPIESDNKVREALEAAIQIFMDDETLNTSEWTTKYGDCLPEEAIRALVPNTQVTNKD